VVKAGAHARIKINAYPDKAFEGKITYVYPTLKAETRSVPVRIELANPGNAAQARHVCAGRTGGGGPGSGGHRADPRQSSTAAPARWFWCRSGRVASSRARSSSGARSDDRVELREGVKEGEQLVVAANFLIDAESNLKAAVDGFAPSGGGQDRGDQCRQRYGEHQSWPGRKPQLATDEHGRSRSPTPHC
jgi:Cu(I)/Ag(I) efflux system membrane fusion protein